MKNEKLTALEARDAAQRIAFAPIAFQAARSLRDLGILREVERAGREGISLPNIAKNTDIPIYGVRVLLEAGLGMNVVGIRDNGEQQETWFLDKTGYFLLNDEMTVANMDFSQDVCYDAMNHLSESVKTGKPAGLHVFGEQWDTVYQALSSLKPQVQKSWFAFDHYYSDQAFPEVVENIRAKAPKTLLDIGGNTGKWAIFIAQAIPSLHVTIADLPGQLEMAKQKVADAGLSDRISFIAVDLLNPEQAIPGEYDIIWMSQFLDCFGESEITSICKRCRPALAEQGEIFILEHFWDEQPYEAGAYSLQMTSLYFTAIANGTSQMYRSTVFIPCVEKAGFKIQESVNGNRWGHTLLRCAKA